MMFLQKPLYVLDTEENYLEKFGELKSPFKGLPIWARHT